MAIDKVKAFLRERGMEERVLEFETSSATVELAAQAVGCEPARIAKTLSFHVGDRVALVVAAGDARIDNPKYKARFGCKAKMLAADEAEPLIGTAWAACARSRSTRAWTCSSTNLCGASTPCIRRRATPRAPCA